MRNREQDVRKFFRAADQRLKAAEFLYANRFYLDSVYLAGYVVECSLKALILAHTLLNIYAQAYERLTRGSKAHEFDFLKATLQRSPINVVLPKAIHDYFRRVNTWSTALRYETSIGDPDRARLLLEAVRAIQGWTQRS